MKEEHLERISTAFGIAVLVLMCGIPAWPFIELEWGLRSLNRSVERMKQAQGRYWSNYVAQVSKTNGFAHATNGAWLNPKP